MKFSGVYNVVSGCCNSGNTLSCLDSIYDEVLESHESREQYEDYYMHANRICKHMGKVSRLYGFARFR